MRSHRIALAATTLTLGLVVPGGARADSGGASAPAAPVAAGKVGGTAFSAAHVRGVARVTVGGGARPAVRVRVAAVGLRRVSAVLVVRRGTRRIARIALGTIAANRVVAVRWPTRLTLRPGHYVLIVRAGGRQRRARLTVHGVHHPVAPRPTPPTPVVHHGGVFPVAGAHSFGDGFGAPRKGYSHQGQDVLGATGTPIVAPLGGSIVSTGYQASAAGEYVVLDASDGHAYFFAHCIRHSTVVTAGQVVTPGADLCRLGATGDATGPHLHFEEWVGGWRVSKASHPVDPLPQLRAWEH